MTGKELKAIRQSIPRWKNGEKNPDLTPDDWKKHKELDCIEMINSILAYNWFGESAEQIMSDEENKHHNYLAEYVYLFGRDKVIELIQAQMDSIDSIKRNVHTDSEGLSYNAIIWVDD